ncbi:hypothetical protein [Streptomyces sp. NPDC001108]
MRAGAGPSGDSTAGVFPAPFVPRSAGNQLGRTVKLTPRTASKAPRPVPAPDAADSARVLSDVGVVQGDEVLRRIGQGGGPDGGDVGADGEFR